MKKVTIFLYIHTIFFRYSNYCYYIFTKEGRIQNLSCKIVVNNNFLLCKIDTLRYELKHCPAANQSIREEYNKRCVKLRTIVKSKKEKNQNVFYEWENKKF